MIKNTGIFGILEDVNLTKEQIVKQARELNPIDDIFFNKMAEDKAVCAEIISTILRVKVEVLSVVPQDSLRLSA